MSRFAIETHGLGKQFKIGVHSGSNALHQTLEAAVRRLIPGLRPEEQERGVLWALRDIDFKIEHGELVGLVGHNGAGKSVLLKLLSRITHPSEGHALIAGKVGSMLEVGAGFHPEFTGRENVFLVGATLGLRINEIRERFDEIVGFADVGNLLDTPVKRYSSGMFVRLAFSVAAHLDANIMLFDEVISVGDTSFREKCLDRIAAMAAEGRTVILVSHNMATIERYCLRTLVLDRGTLVADGPTSQVLATLDRTRAH